MKLTSKQYEILSFLVGSDLFYPFSCFEGTKKELKKEFKILREAGLVRFQNGLMTDEGMFAGSGHGVEDESRDRVSKLLKEWEAKESQ